MNLPTVYQLKPAFQKWLRPLVSRLAHLGITANQVTLLAVGVSSAQGLWLLLQPDSRWAYLGLPVVLFIRMALNAIDGMLAREHHQKSKLGGILNELGDVLSDTVLYLPCALHPEIPVVPVILFVILAILTEFAGLCAQTFGGERRYDGPMGKSDRALFWGVTGFLVAIDVSLLAWFAYALILSLILLGLTLLNRIRKGIR